MSRELRHSATLSDVVIVAVLLVVGVVSPSFLPSQTGTALTVQARGQTQVFSLTEDRRITVEGDQGVTVIEIERGRARIVQSACRNQRWHHSQVEASLVGQTVACVPNRVLAEVTGERDVDAVMR